MLIFRQKSFQFCTSCLKTRITITLIIIPSLNQLFTGRNFEYDEALEIIQFEEYSEDIDFDEIRRYDIQKKIGNVDRKVNLRKGRMNEGPQNDNFFERRRKRKRFKPGFDLDHIEKEKKKVCKNICLFKGTVRH